MIDKKFISEQQAGTLKGGKLRRTRVFKGVIPPKTAFEKAHLKAYLKGKKHFRHGFSVDVKTGRRYATTYNVDSELGYFVVE